MKKSKKRVPKIVQIIEASTIPDIDKKIAIHYILSVSKSDARRAYCGFSDTANKLVDAFTWTVTHPGFDYWSNLNNQLLNNLTNY